MRSADAQGIKLQNEPVACWDQLQPPHDYTDSEKAKAYVTTLEEPAH